MMRVEDVWPVPVHLYAVHLLTTDIAAKVRPLVDDQATLASVRSQTGKGGSEQAGAYYQVVVWFVHVLNVSSDSCSSDTPSAAWHSGEVSDTMFRCGPVHSLRTVWAKGCVASRRLLIGQ